jgi:hypothetical protein
MLNFGFLILNAKENEEVYGSAKKTRKARKGRSRESFGGQRPEFQRRGRDTVGGIEGVAALWFFSAQEKPAIRTELNGEGDAVGEAMV